MKKTIYLIDGSSFLYRAFYALKPMVSPSGQQVGAVYGFCRMVKKIIDTFLPDYLALVWDTKGATMRSDLYPDYKATRQVAPMHLFDQKFIIQNFAKQINLAQIEMSGYEADDLLYSIARDFSQKGFKVVIITTDKDLAQIVTDDILLYDAFKLEFFDRGAIEAKYGFPIEKLPFYFALCGDSSDNIPGVRGIGPKGARDLVAQFDSLTDMYANLDKVPKERTRTLLEAAQKEAFLSEQLFLLIYTHLNVTEQDLSFSPDDWTGARGFFDMYDFKSLVKELPGQKKKEKNNYKPAGSYTAITTMEELEQVVQEIKKQGVVAIDTETDGVSVFRCQLVGISLCTAPGKAYYIPLNHIDETALKHDDIIDILKPLFESSDIKKIFHHAKFDMHALARAGIQVEGLVFDTLIAANLLRQDNERIGLKVLSESYFNEQMLSFDQVVTQNKYKNFSYVPLTLATEYAAADAHQTCKLVTVLKQELEKEGLINLFDTIEMPLITILYAMEQAGIVCDVHVLDELNHQVTKDLREITERIIDMVGPQYFAINLNSPAQLKELLFEHLKLPTLKKTTSKSNYSTDQEVLEELALLHPVPALIIKYRELAKLKNTYIDGLKQWINPQTNKIYTTFNQTQVATGRLSSSDPNLQNIPAIADEQALHIRAAFKPDPGEIFISADYSQIELRVVAYLSQDPALIKAFTDQADIHTYTAAHIFGVEQQEVTKAQRQVGKRINFSILYGLTPFGLSKDLKIPYAQAKEYIDAYFKQYAAVTAWMERVVEDTKKNGYVTTLSGRRRYMPSIYERNKTLYEGARRVAINTQSQGTAAEVMKMAMIKLDTRLKSEKICARMVLQIHDELVVSAAVHEKERAKAVMLEVMETIVDWNVPLLVTLSEGYSWADASK